MYRFFKRLLDIILVIIAILLAVLPMIAIMAFIKKDSNGSAIFKQERAGKNGKPFLLYKFRTMRTDVDPFGASPKSGQDTRLTNMGKILREHSLDELPQLFNILKGEMSIVGPRPLYIAQIAEWDERQKRRLEVKPGLTGLAQISGRGELTREQKLEYDVEYVEKATFGFDIKIIFKTFAQVFNKQEIYEKDYSETEETRGDNNPEDNEQKTDNR
jgi:undecaprenyl phosphate N,N'-diacetylbacillosamine 1-phosphate transferase